MTDSLFGDRRYEETIYAAMISADNKSLVVLGEKYHYVFDASPLVLRVMRSSIRKNINLRFSEPFHVKNTGKTVGRCALQFTAITEADKIVEAEKIGFTPRPYMQFLQLDMPLVGQQFDVKGFDSSKVHDRFERPYRVDAYQEQPLLEKIIKSPLSPVTVAADGVLRLILIDGILVPLWHFGGGK